MSNVSSLQVCQCVTALITPFTQKGLVLKWWQTSATLEVIFLLSTCSSESGVLPPVIVPSRPVDDPSLQGRGEAQESLWRSSGPAFRFSSVHYTQPPNPGFVFDKYTLTVTDSYDVWQKDLARSEFHLVLHNLVFLQLKWILSVPHIRGVVFVPDDLPLVCISLGQHLFHISQLGSVRLHLAQRRWGTKTHHVVWMTVAKLLHSQGIWWTTCHLRDNDRPVKLEETGKK